MATSIVTDFGDGSYTVAFDDYYIDTTLTASGDDVDWWLDEVYRKHHRRLDRLVVGLDVEWRPPCIRGVVPPVAVLQLCVGSRCLVFQIRRADYVPNSLFDFLADDRFTFVGVGIREDVAKLREGYQLEVEKAVDLRCLAANKLGKLELQHRGGLQAVVWEVLGVRFEKPLDVRISAWDAPRLSPEQLQYACADAFASFEVGRRLFDGEYATLFRLCRLKLLATVKSIVAIAIFVATIHTFVAVVVLAYPSS